MHAKVAQRVQRDWKQVFASFAQSGLSVKEFCLREGIAPSLFYQRRKRYSNPQPVGTGAAALVSVCGRASGTRPGDAAGTRTGPVGHGSTEQPSRCADVGQSRPGPDSEASSRRHAGRRVPVRTASPGHDKAGAAADAVGFIEVQSLRPASPVAVISFPNGVELAIGGDCDPALLGHIVRILKDSPC